MINANGNGTGKRAVLYARVSGDDRKYATSGIESQLDDCRKYAEEQGYRVAGEHYETPDKHTSGAEWLPEILKIIEKAEAGGFDVLVVREVDRLARDRLKFEMIKNDLRASGVRIEYVIGQFDESAEGELMEGVIAQLAAYEKAKTAQRLKRGRLRSVKAGNVTIGGSYAPYGYDVEEIDGTRQLVINEAEAEIVRLIFNKYAYELETLHGLANYLDEHNVPKPAKGNNHEAVTTREKWSVGTLSGILSNETYVGRWYYRKTKRVKMQDGSYRNVERPRSEWIEVEAPAIVPEDTFELVEKRRKQNKRQKGKNRKYPYPMSGIMTCGHCGNGLSGMTRYHTLSTGERKAYRYYKCNARHLPKRYGFKCENPQTRIEEVDGRVWQWVKRYILDPEELRSAWESHRERQLDDARPLVRILESNEKRLTELEAEKARLIRAYTAGALSLDEIAEEKTRVDKRIADLSEAIQEMRAELADRLPQVEDFETIEKYAGRIRKGASVADDDPEAQQEIYRLLQMEVTLTHEGGEHVADVRCVLGEERLSTVNSTVGYSDFAWR